MLLPLLLLSLAQETDDIPLFKADSKLVPVHFHVVRDKRYAESLRPEEIVLLEDGKPQPVTLFEGGLAKRTTPIEIMLLFDVSGSVQNRALLEPLSYEKALLHTSLNVKVSVYGFAAKLFRFSGPTRNPAELGAAFRAVAEFGPGHRPRALPLVLPPGRKDAQGGSWIYEAVIAVAKEGARARDGASRMILVFSDGQQTTDARVEDAAGLATELGIGVYPVAVGHRERLERLRGAKGQMQRARLESLEHDLQEFAQLGELTGGRSFDPFQIDTRTVDQILRFMAAQVMFEYVAGFAPEASAGGAKKHKVQVKLAVPKSGKVLGGTRTVVH